MAAVFEPFDTPMLDYQSDMDVQMHPNSDSWFHEEANMEAEDTYPLTRTSSGDLVDVEIEMENYLEEDLRNPEYEMVDEAEVEAASHSVPTEYEDVVVMDASHQPSSLQELASETIPPAEIPSDSHTQLEEEAISSTTDPVISALADASTGTDMPPSEFASEDTVLVDGALVPDIPVPTSVHEEGLHLEPSSTQIVLEDLSTHVEEFVSEEEHVPGPTLDSAVVYNEGDNEDLALASAAIPTAEEDGTGPVAADASSQVEEDVVGPTQVDANAFEQSEFAVQATDVSVERPSEYAENEEENQVQLPENDPHEISEGVYIDPPPAVILSFAFVEHADVCLFNQPSQSDPSSSKTIMSVCLSDQPTLYYEPLSAVFDALRRDPEVSTLADLSQGELILDAFDLELSISEDNVFAREISLHDLNVLHDGLDFTGSLRLRLQLVNSRFIIRYRMLQEQVSRLSLNDAGEEYTAEELNESLLQESIEQETSEQEHGPTSTEGNQEYQENNEDTSGTSYQQAENHPETDTAEFQLDASNEGDADYNDEHTGAEEDQYTQETEGTELEEGVEENNSLYDDAPEEQEQAYPADPNVVESTGSFVDGGDAYENSEEVPQPEENFEEYGDQRAAVEPQGEPATSSEESPSHPAISHQHETEISGEIENEASVEAEASSESHLNQLQDAETYQEDDLYYDDTADAEWDGSEYEDAVDDDNDVDKDADTTLDTEADGEHETASAQSSTTLSSRHSKRSIHDLDDDGDDNNAEDLASAQSSPGAKRVRTE
ncbi:hypothetical protein C8R42DRAFT_655106 [Lentinula raphanica]|nr:hypothetical protein C8R42DRAFT_655106 [Lentinula raphanica]